MRLIDADALFAAFELHSWYNNSDRDDIAEELLLNAPTIEAFPVRHGHWIKLSKCDMCSECKYSTGRYESGGKYCPDCGAKMAGWIEGAQMRLINADTLRDWLLYNGENENIYCASDFLDSIDATPTIDAEPVRHARWEKRKEDALVHWDCTNCGIGYLDDAGLDKLHYCPNCGAKMGS